jgi:SAM-dependent methyltransferase
MTEPQVDAPDETSEPDGSDEPGRVVPRHAVMRQLCRLYPEARYLEVGVWRGATFDRVPAPRKVAVDPTFRLTPPHTERDDAGTDFHEVTSDDYFATIVGRDEKFDVVFLDGLHVYEQTLRDLVNALDHLAPDGVVVVDDTHPPTHLAALPDRDEHFAVRDYVGATDKRWMGDIYKLVWFVQTFCPHLTYRTISDNHGQTVFWRKPRADVPRRTLGQVADLTFEQMVVDEDVLQLRPWREIRRELRADLGL